MVIHPNKPVLFSVEHQPDAVEKEWQKFKQAILGKRFLFIELSPHEVDEVIVHKKIDTAPQIGAFQRLVRLAHEAGLKVFPLDSAKYDKEFMNLLHSRPPHSEKQIQSKVYQEYIKREKLWREKLTGKDARTLVVMDPANAIEISKQPGIPKENVPGTLDFEGKALEAEKRRLAEIEARRIESERFERRKAKARARMRKRIF
ncbi:MAG: hypothetical protein HY917_01755 [Candidatus Diapherotrites archaeon]|nr:hypothetical protein [Candidatus Diapherotrites archaeon]